MNEAYVCPRCGQNGRITFIKPILDNVRCDVVECDCGAMWRVYYKFENFQVEVMAMPIDNPNTETVLGE